MIQPITLHELVQRHGSWLESGVDEGPVISSRVRLARNLEDYHFPGWASEEQKHAIWKQTYELFSEMDDAFMCWKMESLPDTDRELLFERHLISQELANKEAENGVFVSPDEMMAIMINEEDHIRIQTLKPGLQLKQAWEAASRIDDQLEQQLLYAYHARLGFLTSCPSNVGTGLRASVMLHLPGLVLLEEMDPVVNGISKIGLAVRGMWGEGSEAVGNMFQVSNQITLGKGEEQIVNHLEQIVLELVEHEQNARQRLLHENPIMVKDHIARSFGLLAHAKLMASGEALNLLSTLRLGLDLGMVSGFSRQEMDQLYISTQPAHLQKIQQSELAPNDRDFVRAEMLRNFMKRATLKVEQE
ncbi:MAG: protein arginine kinase [Kiritimatiellaceae bacterium]|nr:protein arginine kinase [Kiritimatiellaceae bacterium]RZO88218.1 MAG: protein arginine kinase [Kiritimatiellaceae bacterium]|tara:strand:- start:3620 stop:4696 length:1077 start_codon:yes stop_codon:yes gene_type:complete